jgi:glycosyltransferase involved in cell wall biosynthesis
MSKQEQATMDVSVVICTRNRPDLIGAALASVLANTYPSFDVLVVDQSEDDRTGEIVRAQAQTHPRLRYLHTPIAGLSRAYNIGVRETTGEVLAFTDDDCVAPPDWVQNVASAFAAEPDADLLYGQVCLPPEMAAKLADESGTVPTLDIEHPQRISRVEGFRLYGMGANFAARRRLFQRIGGFDEIMGGGGALKSSQDFDFQYRAYVAGATLLLRPEVKVDHYGFRSDDQWPATLRAYGVGDGAFYGKHIRCGDLFALSLLARRMGRLLVREALNPVRRKPSQAIYLRSCFQGLRESLRFPVDKQQRLYLAPAA